MKDKETENKKWWLFRYKNNNEKVGRLKRKLYQLDLDIINYSSHSYSCARFNLQDLHSDKKDLEKRIDRLENKGKKLREEIGSVIYSVDDCKLIKILKCVFIDGYSFEETANIVGYSTRYVFTLYSKALKKIDIPVVCT